MRLAIQNPQPVLLDSDANAYPGHASERKPPKRKGSFGVLQQQQENLTYDLRRALQQRLESRGTPDVIDACVQVLCDLIVKEDIPVIREAIKKELLEQARKDALSVVPVCSRPPLEAPYEVKTTRLQKRQEAALRFISERYAASGEKNPVRVMEIAEHFGKSRSAIWRLLSQPVNQGLLHRNPDPQVGGYTPDPSLKTLFA